MRQFINILSEARTKTRDKTGFDLMPELDKGALATTTTTPPPTVPGTSGTRGRTRRAMGTANVDPAHAVQAAQHLGQLPDMPDEIDNAEAARRAGLHDANVPTDDVGQPEIVPTTENLPAVIHQEMVEGGGRVVEPDWHQVKHLPGYMQQPIRSMGRSVFRQFTNTPIEDIQVLTTLGGINPERDVTGMMQWIRHHGVRDDSRVIDFSAVMPGYTADVSLWNTQNFSFLLVHDFAGYYIYGWKEGRGVHLDAPAAPRLLR